MPNPPVAGKNLPAGPEISLGDRSQGRKMFTGGDGKEIFKYCLLKDFQKKFPYSVG